MTTLDDYDTDILILGLTVWREARNQPQLARRAVANTAVNRARDPHHRWPREIRAVCLQPHQFSCFNAGDPNATRWPSLASPVWHDCLDAAAEAIASTTPDPSHGATFYFSPPLIRPPASWGVVELTAQIGVLRFWRIRHLPDTEAST